jgi:cytochrome c1
MMNEERPCPNPKCVNGKVQTIEGFVVIWADCPICHGKGNIRIRIPDEIVDHQYKK